jgi:general secretion pathway protein E
MEPLPTKTRVLVVEDEIVVSEDLQQRLMALGFEIAGAADTASDAIRLATSERPDVALVDVMLHGRPEGIDAAEHLRGKLNIPVIYLTAHSDRATLQKARLTDPSGYIVKPFDDVQLRVAIELAPRRHELESKARRAEPSPLVARLLPYGFARAGQILLAHRHADEIEVWISECTAQGALAEVSRNFGALTLVLLPADELQQWINSTYASQGGSAAQVVGEVEGEVDLSRLMQDIPEIEDLLESEDDAPIIRMINVLLTQATREGASDIHIEPFENASVVRIRVDGMLRDLVRPKKELHGALISRIKIMAQLDIAEKRLPQDGRITLRVGGRPVDVRVSTLPTGHGERAVLRLLEKDAQWLNLETLGMAQDTLAEFDKLIGRPHGIVLVTGPTGSGKTTTLYAALSRLETATLNIMTVEDPIEYDLVGIGQTQVNERIGMNFARALRSILRQDPDIIMIGEIRDLETATIAVQASLTGHLVFATLHTNDAASAVTRLTDMGVEPYLLGSSLLGVLAQRLVRQLCPVCKESRSEPGGRVYWHPAGCDKCAKSGYSGRLGIYELLLVDDAIRSLIHDNLADAQLLKVGRVGGMRTLREDAERWLTAGFTSLEEVVRATGGE